jgi:hypothetical protein
MPIERMLAALELVADVNQILLLAPHFALRIPVGPGLERSIHPPRPRED